MGFRERIQAIFQQLNGSDVELVGGLLYGTNIRKSILEKNT